MKKLLTIILLSSSLLAKILIQGAMPVEVDTLINALEDKKEIKVGSYLFYEGKIAGKEVVISRTLIGLVNAAAATSIGIERFNPTMIINQGTAGAIVEGLKLGDLLVGDKIYNAGSYYTAYSKNTINPYAKEPMLAPLTLLDENNNDVKNAYFTSDKELVKKALEVGKDDDIKLLNIASADAFNKEILLIQFWHKLYGASVEEMETVASAQVAKAYNIPFLAVRVVSDNIIDGIEYQPKIAYKCQEFIIKLLNNL